jgi:hypothetical protein
MKKFNLMTAILALLLGSESLAAIAPRYQDIKLPTQQMVEKQTILAPAAGGTTNILNAHAGPTSAAALSVTSFVAQPDVPRNLVITPGFSTADVGTCTVTVSGTDFFGASITEDFAFADNASTATTGNKAFKTVTSISFAASCEDGSFAAKWFVGYGEKLGLKRCLSHPGHVLFSTAGSLSSQIYESTRPTISSGGTTAVSLNTADFNGTMNGANNFEIFFFQNYRCLP